MRKPAHESKPFGRGITQPKAITCKAIERRLLELLAPLVEKAGGYVTTLEDVGEGGMTGLSLTLGPQSWDIVIREART
jgi:hypothetical protein